MSFKDKAKKVGKGIWGFLKPILGSWLLSKLEKGKK